MTHILHLSDLHLDPLASPTQPTLLANLGKALEAEHAKLPKEARILALITGDLFQTSNLPPTAALAAFEDLLARIHGALGADIPVLLVPGNHDCRRSGVIGPHDAHRFEAIRAAFPTVLAIPRGQRLARIDLAPFDLPVTLAALDSTVLPRGKLSAGGTLPHLELLEQWRSLTDPGSEGPLVVVAHHHLIPTPVTDLNEIDSSRESALFQFLLRRVVPDLVANANFEELLQTALGAGTTLTTLSLCLS